MLLSRFFGRSEVSSTRRPAARRRPALEALEGRQLLSTLAFTKIEFTGTQAPAHTAYSIKGSHIGVVEVQGAHIGSEMIVGNHIGSAMIQGAHIGSEMIVGNHIGTNVVIARKH